MNPEQHDRNAAMMARMGYQTNGDVPMGPGGPTRMRPNMGTGPGIQPIPKPTPPKWPPVTRLSGPNTKIPPKMDPAKRYNNGKEKMLVNDNQDSELSGVKASLTLILLIILAGSVFVINERYRFFWLVIVGLGAILMIGNRVYSDLYNASIDTENNDEDQRKKYANFAGGVLYAIYLLFAVVMANILLVLLWKVYGQVTKRSNLINNKEPKQEVDVFEVEEEELVLPPPRPQPQSYNNGMSKKERKRMKRMQQRQMMNQF